MTVLSPIPICNFTFCKSRQGTHLKEGRSLLGGLHWWKRDISYTVKEFQWWEAREHYAQLV